MLHHWFANSWALWLLASLLVLGGFAVLAWRQRRRALTLLGIFPALYLERRKRRGVVLGLILVTGMILLILGIAGPQWGQQSVRAEDLAMGRDLVVVLDLSRSMLAQQPSRQERALAALKNLADALQVQGGHRIALVTFAAHARMVFPLTADYDHLRETLTHLDADNLPPALRPRKADPVASGTRIGEALRVAVAALEPKGKAQDILLLSDGDDPARDDEWAVGAEAARSEGIPVFTVGIGDPVTASTIPTRKGPLKHNGAIVLTRLEERPLQEIARRTHGAYLAARDDIVPLGSWWRRVIAARGGRRTAVDEQGLPLAQPRYVWFFAAALACFALTLAVRPASRRVYPGSMDHTAGIKPAAHRGEACA